MSGETGTVGSGELGDGSVLERVPTGLRYGLEAAFGAFFLISGVAKIMDPISFRDQILGYQLIGDPYAAVVAVGLPVVEILTGAALIFATLRLGALCILSGALVVFLYAIISAWVRGLEGVECGCFGAGGAKSQYLLWVIRNGVLLSLGLFLLLVGIVSRNRGGEDSEG